MTRDPLVLVIAALLGACAGKASPPADGGEVGNDDAGDAGETTGGATTGATSSATSNGSGITTQSDDAGSDGSTTDSFIIMPDVMTGECDPWTQDCNDGEKCMPWANDGGSSWNDTKCVPIDGDAAQPGDPCTVEGSGVSGLDDCDIGAMCWDVDPETNMGTCVAFCTGSDTDPSCEDPETTCVIANNGVLILCLPVCDPLLQECVDGQACYPVNADFACAPDASGPDLGAYGSPCEYINACDPGLFCAEAALVPDCAGAQGCCSEFCDFADPQGAAQCSGAAGGQECTPWFADGEAPPGFEQVGACGIPQ